MRGYSSRLSRVLFAPANNKRLFVRNKSSSRSRSRSKSRSRSRSPNRTGLKKETAGMKEDFKNLKREFKRLKKGVLAVSGAAKLIYTGPPHNIPKEKFPEIGMPSSPMSERSSPRKRKRENPKPHAKQYSNNAHNRSDRLKQRGFAIGAPSTGKTLQEINLTSWWSKYKKRLSEKDLEYLYLHLHFQPRQKMTELLKTNILTIVREQNFKLSERKK